MSIAHTCIYDTFESCKYAKYWYGKPVMFKCKDCNRNPNNYPKTQVGTKEELKPIDTSKYKITETGQVVKMTEEKLCGGKTFKEVMQEVEFHISDKEKIAKLEKENAQLRLKLDALEGQIPWQDIKDKSEVIGKLTKAKELLRKFLDSKNIDERCVAESEAEQFLKECGE